MAYAEMRLILARILWKFDLELLDKSHDWYTRQKTYLAWEKPPLMVNIRERE
jgi:cytochrome P450